MKWAPLTQTLHTADYPIPQIGDDRDPDADSSLNRDTWLFFYNRQKIDIPWLDKRLGIHQIYGHGIPCIR